MAALTDNRLRNNYCSGTWGEIPVAVKGGEHIFKGALVGVIAGDGLLIPATEDADFICLGVAKHEVDASSASDGELFCGVLPGRWGGFASGTAGDAITAVNLGQDVYAIDDNTVGLTDGTGTRGVAGKFIGLDDRGKLILSVGSAF